MPKYTVTIYAYAEFEVEADNPKQANLIAMECPIDFDLVKSGDCPEVLDYSWSWSDCMGSEVRNEEGETVLCDY